MTTTFQINDLVKIIKQPTNQWALVEGLVGFVEELQEANGMQYIYFCELNSNGLGGTGSIPYDCVQHLDNGFELEQAVALKRKYDERRQKLYEENVRWSKFCLEIKTNALLKAKNETGVSLENIQKIFNICEDYLSEIDSHRHQ